MKKSILYLSAAAIMLSGLSLEAKSSSFGASDPNQSRGIDRPGMQSSFDHDGIVKGIPRADAKKNKIKSHDKIFQYQKGQKGGKKKNKTKNKKNKNPFQYQKSKGKHPNASFAY